MMREGREREMLTARDARREEEVGEGEEEEEEEGAAADADADGDGDAREDGRVDGRGVVSTGSGCSRYGAVDGSVGASAGGIEAETTGDGEGDGSRTLGTGVAGTGGAAGLAIGAPLATAASAST